jgi:hypothetical protein
MEGMAFHQPDECQADTLHRAVSSHCIQGVPGTGRFKPASRAEQGGNHEAVPMNDPQTQLLHFNQTLAESGEFAAMTCPTSVSSPRVPVPAIRVWGIQEWPGRESSPGAAV